MTPVLAQDMAALAVGWRSIGLRAAEIEWQLPRPVRLFPPLASKLRSALGPALVKAGVSQWTLRSIPGDDRAPGLWFTGWDCAPHPSMRVRAGLRCVEATAREWPAVVGALARLELPADGRLVRVHRCSITWLGLEEGGDGGAFGPPLIQEPALSMRGGGVLVEAVTPLQLKEGGTAVCDAPPFHVLVRSAGERLRQLCQEWGDVVQGLLHANGTAAREARDARLVWARADRTPQVRRLTSGRHRQPIGGVRGTFAYDGVTPLAMAVLALGAQVGIGKGVAFGCGQIRLYEMVTR